MIELTPGFRLEIKQALSDSDRQQIFGWSPDIFGVGDLTIEWRLKDVHFIAYEKELAASHVGTLLQTVEAGRDRLHVCGVGGVTTRPEFQGRMLAQTLLREALSHGRESGADFGFLFCFPRLIDFYLSQGWSLLDAEVLVRQREEEIQPPVRAMVIPLGRGVWPEGTVRLLSHPW